MALLVCTGCTARYSVGAAQCPQCGSTEYVEEGAEDMAKITVHGGVSNAAADAEAAEASPAEPTEEVGSEQPHAAPEGAAAYEDWTVEQLKEQLAERNLSKSGKRDDLVQRLREDDAAAKDAE